jgi:hypothetical protein
MLLWAMLECHKATLPGTSRDPAFCQAQQTRPNTLNTFLLGQLQLWSITDDYIFVTSHSSLKIQSCQLRPGLNRQSMQLAPQSQFVKAALLLLWWQLCADLFYGNFSWCSLASGSEVLLLDMRITPFVQPLMRPVFL